MSTRAPSHSFISAFEALGYQPSRQFARFGKGDRWYVYRPQAKEDDLEVVQVAYLVYKPALKAYAPQFGIFSPASRERLIRALPSISKYLHPTFLNGIWPLEARPCWTLFDAATQLGWQPMCIPDPRDPEGWSIRLQDLIGNLLEKVYWSIDNLHKAIALLSKTEAGYVWATSYSVLRLAEIIALSKIARSDIDDLRIRLGEYESMVRRDMFGSKEFQRLLEEFLRVI